MKKILLLLMMFVVISVPSFATNWKYLSTDIHDTIYYIDRDNIRYYKGCADIWTKIIRKNGVWTVSLVRITTDKRLATLSATKYDRYGNVIYSRDYSYYSYYTSKIISDSMGEDLYIAVYYS